QEAGVERFLKYNSAERVLALLNSFEASEVEDYPAISVPTCVIAAMRDHLHAPSDAEQIAAEIPDATLCRIDGSHAVNIDRPLEFNEAVLAFAQ
ncbi:MAG: alpha/beta hydrolase, partial [Myxococcota bacterium]